MVSTKNIREAAQVAQSGKDFVDRIKPRVQAWGAENVYNTDQSGFKLESYFGRTLEVKGTAGVELSYQQSNSATHSYTIQPIISAAGQMITPIMVVLPEKNGKFGVRVRDSMFKHPVLYTKATTSGLVTKPIVKDWYRDVFYAHCGDICILMVDSLTTYKDQEYYDEVKPDHIQCELQVIPPGTTGQVQPCDVGFFRPFKNFHRRLSSETRLKCPLIKIYARDNILRLIAVTHIQFSAPLFKNFIQHSFVKCGYINRPSVLRFTTPLQYCFNKDVKKNLCSARDCEETAIIQCAWCKDMICMMHLAFCREIHFCSTARSILNH